MFEEWNVGTSITLGAQRRLLGRRRRRSAGVTFLYFTDPNAAVNAFTTGDVDILTGVNSDLVGPLQDNPDYVVNEGTTNGEFTLGFNNAREPFTDRDVRLAIRQAIDKEGVQGAVQRLRHDHRRTGAADRSVVRGPHRHRAVRPRRVARSCSTTPATATGST